MRFVEVDFGEKGLFVFEFIEIRAVERFCGFEIEIGFGVIGYSGSDGFDIGGEISSVAKIFGDEFYVRGQGSHAAMVVRADGGLIHAGHDRRTAWRADGRSCKTARVTRALAGET